jgi:HSP20 family protein
MTTTSTDLRPSTDVSRWNPWPELFDWNPRLTQLLDAIRHNGDHAPGGQLEETDEAFILELDLPGVAKDDITIDVTGPRVSVHGSRSEKKTDATLRHSTRTTGSFSYELRLPTPVDDGAVTASLDSGVLTVTMPKASGAKTTRVTIK